MHLELWSCFKFPHPDLLAQITNDSHATIFTSALKVNTLSCDRIISSNKIIDRFSIMRKSLTVIALYLEGIFVHLTKHIGSKLRHYFINSVIIPITRRILVISRIRNTFLATKCQRL